VKRMFRAAILVLLAVFPELLGVAAAAADKIKVVATFTVIADMVTNVAGDLVDPVTIVGPDGDADEYEPTVADVPKIANARILFMNGLNDDFEPWLGNLMKQQNSPARRSSSAAASRRSARKTSIRSVAGPRPRRSISMPGCFRIMALST
jgi:zinc/manganese transport system substrate-binding protein